MDIVNGTNISEYWHEINNEIIIIMIHCLFIINDFYEIVSLVSLHDMFDCLILDIVDIEVNL